MTSPTRTLLSFASISLLSATAAAQDPAVDARLQKLETTVQDQAKQIEQLTSGGAVRSFWKDGLRFESLDKKNKFRIGGRVHYDLGFFDTDSDLEAAIGQQEDGGEFRRARISLSGELGERYEWATGFDFAGAKASFRDVYMGIKDLPFGNLRIGQFKEPYGLEQITSSNNITFIERSLMNSFVPAFNAGMQVADSTESQSMTWAVGVFRQGTDDGEVSKGDGEYALTARVTGAPMHSEEDRQVLHLGLGASMRNPVADQVTFSAKPEANLSKAFVDVVNLAADEVLLIGAEAAWGHGPFSVQGEYTIAQVDAPTGSDSDFSGWYVQLSYFLTGENRPYNRGSGAFGAIKPANAAFDADGGWGAWELALRLSSIDLDDGPVNEGSLQDLTFGVNWYLTQHMRWMGNFIHSELDPAAGSDGSQDALLFRFQVAY